MILVFIFLFSELIILFSKIEEKKEIDKKNDIKIYIIKSFISIWDILCFFMAGMFKYFCHKKRNNK